MNNVTYRINIKRQDNIGHSEQKQQWQTKLKEIGGVQGPEPTRYGDWERKGRCIDF